MGETDQAALEKDGGASLPLSVQESGHGPALAPSASAGRGRWRCAQTLPGGEVREEEDQEPSPLEAGREGSEEGGREVLLREAEGAEAQLGREGGRRGGVGVEVGVGDRPEGRGGERG